MTSKSEMKCLYFWVKISGFFHTNKSNFCNLTGKVLRFIVIMYLFFKFDDVLFNLNISCRVYLDT